MISYPCPICQKEAHWIGKTGEERPIYLCDACLEVFALNSDQTVYARKKAERSLATGTIWVS